jgi:hypothetical protein
MTTGFVIMASACLVALTLMAGALLLGSKLGAEKYERAWYRHLPLSLFWFALMLIGVAVLVSERVDKRSRELIRHQKSLMRESH